MSGQKPWRKLWRDVNRDTAFLALSVRAQCVFLRLIPEMPDDGKLREDHGSTVMERVALLLSMPKRPTANAVREIVQRGLAVIDDEGSLSLTGFVERQRDDFYDEPRTTQDEYNRLRAEARRRWWTTLLAECEGRCVECKSNDDLTIDHIVALSRGGTNDRENLRVLCRRCNSAKGAR